MTIELTFARVALPHESPEQLRAVMTVGRLVEVLLDEAVPVLVAQVVVFHGADEYIPTFNLEFNRKWNRFCLCIRIKL